MGAFRTRKETIKAAYTAAEAQTRVGEAVSGISEEMGDIGMAMQRAQDKTEQMQARAGALDELLASGVLQDATLPGGRDDVQSQLDALTAGDDADGELARMKAQLPPSAARPAWWRDPGRHPPVRRHHRQGSRPPRKRADPPVGARHLASRLSGGSGGSLVGVVSVGVTTPQHRADLFLDPGSDPREGGPRLGDERTTLNEFLRCQRLTLQLKCDGLDAGQLARRAVEPMIEEYARYNGHADLLRERIDGRVGQLRSRQMQALASQLLWLRRAGAMNPCSSSRCVIALSCDRAHIVAAMGGLASVDIQLVTRPERSFGAWLVTSPADPGAVHARRAGLLSCATFVASPVNHGKAVARASFSR